MENVSFVQKFDRRAKFVTISATIICLALFSWLYFRSTASYISAWFALLSVSLYLLVWIGMPKKTVLTDYGIRVCCTLKLVTIDNIKGISLEHITSTPFPVFSTSGFMGYAGLYYFKREKMMVQVLARNLENLVLVRYDSGKKIVIGVSDVGEFLKTAETFGYKIVSK